MGDTPAEALETLEGAALGREIVDLLEAELVRFRHRVLHDHAIELDRARAAMVLLGRLVGAGVKWTARPDSDPARVHEAFTSLVPRDEKLAPILKREIAAFFAATADVEVTPDEAKTPATLLRRAGADPALWWWAAPYEDAAQCWQACASSAEKTVQVALAFGVGADLAARALAGALGLVMARVRTRAAAAPKLADAIARIGRDGARALAESPADSPDEGSLVATVTKLAFEMMWKKEAKLASDPFAELTIHTFQLVEALRAWRGVADVERFGALASRIEAMQCARGFQISAIVRKDLEAHVADAIRRL